jgi:hypothetical protein
MRQVRQRHQDGRPPLLDLVELDLELADALPALLAGGEQVRRVLPLPLRTGDLVPRGVLIPFEAFEFRDHPPAAGFERRELLQLPVDRQTAVTQSRPDVIEPIANERRVEHR